MHVVLIGAELEENLGLRYMVSALAQRGHTATIVPFNEEGEIPNVVSQVIKLAPDIAGSVHGLYRAGEGILSSRGGASHRRDLRAISPREATLPRSTARSS